MTFFRGKIFDLRDFSTSFDLRKKSDIADLNTDLKANIQALKKQNDASDKELNKSKCIIQNYRDKVQTMEEQISKESHKVSIDK